MLKPIAKFEIYNCLDNSIAERWKQQYWNGVEWRDTIFNSSKEVYEKLLKLEQTLPVDLDAVEALLNNDSWTKNYCSCCGESTRSSLISLDVNCGEYVYNLCLGCLTELKDALSAKLEN